MLLVAPALGLGALGVVMVSSAMARHGMLAFGDSHHFIVRQAISVLVAALLGVMVVRVGPERLLAHAPWLFLAAILLALAVLTPGLGIKAGGATRWLRVGSLSFAVAPAVALGTSLLMAAWGRPAPEAGTPADPGRRILCRRRAAILLGLLAVLTLVAEPDFSAAAVVVVAGAAALVGLGFGGRRVVPAVLLVALVLGLSASRFGYVGGRMSGYLAPERDRRGAGWEVLALARANANATPTGVGLGRGVARRHLSSPGSDYVFAVIREELGSVAAVAVFLGWMALGAAAVTAAWRRSDRRHRALALAAGAAVVTPAMLHMAVCTGLVPIMGVSMPFVSYDPSATVAGGVEVGIIAGVLLAPAQESRSS